MDKQYLVSLAVELPFVRTWRFLPPPPQGGDFTINVIQEHTRTLDANASAEAGSIGSTMPIVLEEETWVFMRDRVRIEHTVFRVFGGQNKVVEAVQDEASPIPLPGETPKAKKFSETRVLIGARVSSEKIIPGVCSPARPQLSACTATGILGSFSVVSLLCTLYFLLIFFLGQISL